MRRVTVAFRSFAHALKNLLLHKNDLRQIYVTGKNEAYLGQRVTYTTFLSDFKRIRRFSIKVKVKVTLVQALRLCTGRTAHRGSRGIALPFHDHDTRRGLGVSVTPRPLFTPGKTRYPLYRRWGGP